MARNDANATYLAIGFITVSLAIAPEVAFAQAGLRESLERLDRNGNEYIEPEEITPLSRPFLERISRNGRVRLDRPTAIADYQEAARIHHAFQNGVVSTSVRPEAEVTVKPFGVDEGQPMIPDFGLAEIKYPYTADDLDKAERILRSYDRDDDGYIDVSEAQRVRWSYRNPFDDDLDKDSRLGRLELAQRFARRRMLAGDVQELIRKRVRVGSEVRRPPTSSSSSRNDWYRTGGPAVGLTFSLLGQFDSNRNGKLEAYEATRVGIPVGKMDTDQDGEVSREELFAALKEMYDDLEDAVDGLPSWFAERDSNKDDQVSLKEFATEWSSEQLEEFSTFDVNQDGLLTQDEVLKATAAMGGTFRSKSGEILAPRRTVISEIEVQEDFIIGKLTIGLQITHSNVGHFDAYLTGPNGERVELFTAIGGSGNNFDRTVIDDDSPVSIAKVKAPYTGTFRPEAIDKKEPGLKQFSGTSVKGVWQLIIRGTRNDRAGMLHFWSLDAKPIEAPPGESVITKEKSAGETENDESKQEGDTSKPSEEASREKESRDKESRSSRDRDSNGESRRSRFRR